MFSDFTASERKILQKLSTPAKIQDYLNSLPFHFVDANDTCLSPKEVLRFGTAQCMEGAMLAATALRFHGFDPLIVDLTSTDDDADHVIAVFKIGRHWGAISKTNHAVLRYREPIYHSIRELVMSYFHEYFLHDGRKTLRSFTRPINLSRFDHLGWMTSEEPVWFIPEYLVTAKHHAILTPKQRRNLRSADPIEIEAGRLTCG
ncbi:TPA: hypothetical protein DEP96_04375 [Candidatus Uhrbacteria bacterium]|nr:hypothetical protein [Candidatus Uhrbacteria bacterium]